jgi:ABC-type Fe3+/spermidine/putrescine transport system ATPase subunit
MLEVRDVRVSFGDVNVLRGIDLSISSGEIICLLGPSGCGKTTLLRVIAGLEKPKTGDILLDGKSILALPVYQRDFGLMFQDFALFPHLNVADNIAFGLKMSRMPSTQRKERIYEVLELVGLTGYERRDVAQLSGGERQRVALARSLAPNPRLLMLDEPLGSLDAVLRDRLVIELRTIIKRVGLTAVYVTHDQHEAFAIADRIALMNVGHLEQIGTPESIYRHPVSSFAARFLGMDNIFLVLNREGNIVHTAVGSFPVEDRADFVLLHPDGLKLADPDTSDAITGIVTSRVFLGETYQLEMDAAADTRLSFKLPLLSTYIPNVGESISLRILPNAVIPLTT